MMMEDSVMPVQLILTQFLIEEDVLDPNSEYKLNIFTNKTPDTQVQLIESTDVQIYQKQKDWSFSIDVKYFFQIKQLVVLSLLVKKEEETFQILGNALLTLGHFLCLPQQRQQIQFQSQSILGTIVVKASKLTNTLRTGTLNMDWRAGKIANVDSVFDFWKKNDSYLKFMKIRGDNTYADVAKTEIQYNQLSPNWKNIKIQLKNLIDEKYKPISFKIQCWHSGQGQQKQIGQTFVQLEELKKQKLPLQFHLQSANVKKPGNLILEQYDMATLPNLVDYIQQGLKLKLILGIDFTTSNGQPISWESLHYTGKDGKQKSKYQDIVKEIWEVIEEYNNKEIIEAYGFGGKPHLDKIDENVVNHCFPLTGDQDCFQMQGIEHFNEAYVESSKKIELFHPRNLSPFMNKIFERIQKSEKQKQEEEVPNNLYNIIVILTAGEIQDFEYVSEFLSRNSATVPASIIVVNIGKQDEKSLQKIQKNYSIDLKTNFEENTRNIFKYFDYNQHNRNPAQLCRQILKEVPQQIVDYMLMKNKYPQYFNSKEIEAVKRMSSS